MSVLKFRLLLLGLLLVGIGLLCTGWTDLDWMIVCYKFQFGQGLASAVNWEFCPFLSVNWWLAFEFSLLRCVVGSVLIGVFSAFYLKDAVKCE